MPPTSLNARHNAQELLQDAANTAAHAADLAADRARELQRDVRPALEDLAARAQDTLTRGLDAASATRQRAEASLRQYADATGRYVADQPVKSVLIAAAAGATLAALFMAARGRR